MTIDERMMKTLQTSQMQRWPFFGCPSLRFWTSCKTGKTQVFEFSFMIFVKQVAKGLPHISFLSSLTGEELKNFISIYTQLGNAVELVI
jgi:hypothetical protein